MVTIVLRGSSFASMLFIANSMAADVIDVDTLESGEQRSGLFFAVWGMTIKLSLALGVVLGTTLPAVLGYSPVAAFIGPVVQGRLMWVYGGVPAVLMGVGALFLLRFPITRERHALVRAEIEARTRAVTA
jgi:Na+/melibiose symporter-like transporter